MLKISKNITLSGNSEIDGNITVFMNATISTDGDATTISHTVCDQTLYSANIEECRKDIANFTRSAQDIEDELLENTKQEDI